MRVIAGTARSLPLKAPQGLEIRPTTDKIKETLFNMLHWDLPGSIFLDLFSGSGSIGIEALSRGAKKAYFVDHSAKAIACIRQNLAFTKMADRAVVLKQTVYGALALIQEGRADIIFMDPPYRLDLEKEALLVLSRMPYVTEETLIVVEAAIETDFSYLPELGFEVKKEKRYRTNKHLFIEKTN